MCGACITFFIEVVRVSSSYSFSCLYIIASPHLSSKCRLHRSARLYNARLAKRALTWWRHPGVVVIVNEATGTALLWWNHCDHVSYSLVAYHLVSCSPPM